MINKQYILKDLVLSLFVCLLLAGTAGCSNEGMLPEGGEELDNGGTTSFSIVMGRVVTGVPTDGNFDDYISSVRVLAFKDATLKYNMLFTASGGMMEKYGLLLMMVSPLLMKMCHWKEEHIHSIL